MIPAFATAGALICVAMLMMGGMAHIDWDEHTETIPAIVTVIMMPLTFSVADGIALGFITYVAMKVLTGKHREVSASLYALFVIFVAVHLPLTRPDGGWPPRLSASNSLPAPRAQPHPSPSHLAPHRPAPQMADNRQPSAPSRERRPARRRARERTRSQCFVARTWLPR